MILYDIIILYDRSYHTPIEARVALYSILFDCIILYFIRLYYVVLCCTRVPGILLYSIVFYCIICIHGLSRVRSSIDPCCFWDDLLWIRRCYPGLLSHITNNPCINRRLILSGIPRYFVKYILTKHDYGSPNGPFSYTVHHQLFRVPFEI